MFIRTFFVIVALLALAPQSGWAGRIVWPCTGNVTSAYGPRTSPCSGCSTYHHGIDIGVGSGTILAAPASGTVSYYGFDSCGGNIFNISYGGGWVTRFLHCSGRIAAVNSSVSQNQDVARSGNTGSCTTGAHLHFEVRKDGVSQMIPGSPGNRVNRNTEINYEYPGLNDRPKAAPAMLYDVMNSSMNIYRWTSSGSALSLLPVTVFGNGYSLGDVGPHVVACDVDGDGKDDNVVAYQYANNSMRLHVFKSGNDYQGGAGWFQSGSFNMENVAGRMVGGDFNGDGRGDVAMLYDNGSGGMVAFRFLSNGSSFSYSATTISNYDLSRVKDHIAVADVNADGKDDIVIACQTGSTWKMEVLLNGNTMSPNQWYLGGNFSLANVAGRMVGGDFNGDGKGDVALFYKTGAGSMTVYRFTSNGGSFTYSTSSISSGYDLDLVGKHIASGDLDGDGKDDIVVAYQYPDGKFRYHFFKDGLVYGGASGLYQSGPFSLDNVSGRMTMGMGWATNSPRTNSDVEAWAGY